jgi:hypothetical protein
LNYFGVQRQDKSFTIGPMFTALFGLLRRIACSVSFSAFPVLFLLGRFVYHSSIVPVQLTKTSDRPDLSSEGAPDIEKKSSNSQIVINIWSWAPDGAGHQDRLTDWPSVVIHSLIHRISETRHVRWSWDYSTVTSGIYGGWNFSTTRSSAKICICTYVFVCVCVCVARQRWAVAMQRGLLCHNAIIVFSKTPTPRERVYRYGEHVCVFLSKQL